MAYHNDQYVVYFHVIDHKLQHYFVELFVTGLMVKLPGVFKVHKELKRFRFTLTASVRLSSLISQTRKLADKNRPKRFLWTKLRESTNFSKNY